MALIDIAARSGIQRVIRSMTEISQAIERAKLEKENREADLALREAQANKIGRQIVEFLVRALAKDTRSAVLRVSLNTYLNRDCVPAAATAVVVIFDPASRGYGAASSNGLFSIVVVCEANSPPTLQGLFLRDPVPLPNGFDESCVARIWQDVIVPRVADYLVNEAHS